MTTPRFWNGPTPWDADTEQAQADLASSDPARWESEHVEYHETYLDNAAGYRAAMNSDVVRGLVFVLRRHRHAPMSPGETCERCKAVAAYEVGLEEKP